MSAIGLCSLSLCLIRKWNLSKLLNCPKLQEELAVMAQPESNIAMMGVLGIFGGLAAVILIVRMLIVWRNVDTDLDWKDDNDE